MFAAISTPVNPPCRTQFLFLKPQKPIFFHTPKFTFSGKIISRKKIIFRENLSWVPKNMIESRISCGDESLSISNSGQGHAFEQEVLIDDSSGSHSVGWVNGTMNRMSKWFTTAVFGAVILMRHDGKGLWIAMGSVLNVILSTVLKHTINQKRPASALSSDPGMPSSHAQSIFFAVLVTIASLVEWLGVNSATIILSGLLIALGSYFSWLRVLLNYHTTSQVAVGAMVGSAFSISWFWVWNTFVMEAFHSFLWVRVAVVFGAISFCCAFLLHVYQHWIKDEE